MYKRQGGIPFYLEAVRKGESVSQFIDRVCFEKDGILVDEYNVLFQSLFDDSDQHHKIVELLAKKKEGFNRSEIIKKTRFSSGGGLTKVLGELEESGFINAAVPYGKNKTKAYYKLTDNFSIFYLKYMGPRSQRSKPNWQRISQSQSWKSWSGFAFERLCFAHIPQIKKALKLEAMNCEVSHWSGSSGGRGAQIDMLIDRSDRIINLCEIKYANSSFTINKSYAKQLREKLAVFDMERKGQKRSLFLTIITTYGTLDNEYYKELVQSEVYLKDLFAPL